MRGVVMDVAMTSEPDPQAGYMGHAVLHDSPRARADAFDRGQLWGQQRRHYLCNNTGIS
jgi:hypothetical protein